MRADDSASGLPDERPDSGHGWSSGRAISGL